MPIQLVTSPTPLQEGDLFIVRRGDSPANVELVPVPKAEFDALVLRVEAIETYLELE